MNGPRPSSPRSALSLLRYIRLLATLVICYGMAINIVEVTWKSRLKMAFPNPNDYSEFMGAFSAATGDGLYLPLMASIDL